MKKHKHYYTWDDMHRAAHAIVIQMYHGNWKPDYVVGINPSGLPLSVMIADMVCTKHYTIVPFEESNCWMAEDAFGYNDPEKTGITGARWDPKLRKNILVVDNINNTGSQFEWIKKDWQSSCLPNEEHAWEAVWRDNVRFATMTNNGMSDFESRYYWENFYQEWDTERCFVYPYQYETRHYR